MALLFPPHPPISSEYPYPKVCVSPARKRRLKRQEWNIFHDRNVRHALCFFAALMETSITQSLELNPPNLTRHPPPATPCFKAQEETEREGGRRGFGHALPQQGRVIACDTEASSPQKSVSVLRWLRLEENGCGWTRESGHVTLFQMPRRRADRRGLALCFLL